MIDLKTNEDKDHGDNDSYQYMALYIKLNNRTWQALKEAIAKTMRFKLL